MVLHIEPRILKILTEYYRLTISVGENGNVSTIYNVGQIKKDTLPSGRIVSTFKGSKANSVSSSIIPENSEKSNPSGEIRSENLKKAVDTGRRGSFYSGKTTDEGVRWERRANKESEKVYYRDNAEGL